jgi:hypothetical protein
VSELCPNSASKHSDKLISLCAGFQGIDDQIHDAITESFSKLNRGDSLETGLRDVFGLLADGVYTVYTAEYYPTDGNGTFFWGAYNISHEVRGTAEDNHTIGSRTYRPCFLIPSAPLDLYSPKTKVAIDEAVKSRRIQGIAYHLSGLHSVLIKGHHGAVSCAEKDIPFKCAVIERINRPYTDPAVSAAASAPAPAPTPANAAAPNGAPAADNKAAETPETAPAPAPKPVAHDGITGFRSASVKIPLELFPKEMLRQILESRAEVKPRHFNVLRQKMGTVRRKAVSNNVIPHKVLERCDLMPDCEMVESAFAIDSLSDDQLAMLLAGETEYDGKIIISPNFYTSIMTACNFLRFHDEERFVGFALAILDNPELAATHEYIARRVSRLTANTAVYEYFKKVIAEGYPEREKIIAIAERFVKDYELANK